MARPGAGYTVVCWGCGAAATPATCWCADDDRARDAGRQQRPGRVQRCTSITPHCRSAAQTAADHWIRHRSRFAQLRAVHRIRPRDLCAGPVSAASTPARASRAGKVVMRTASPPYQSGVNLAPPAGRAADHLRRTAVFDGNQCGGLCGDALFSRRDLAADSLRCQGTPARAAPQRCGIGAGRWAVRCCSKVWTDQKNSFFVPWKSTRHPLRPAVVLPMLGPQSRGRHRRAQGLRGENFGFRLVPIRGLYAESQVDTVAHGPVLTFQVPGPPVPATTTQRGCLRHHHAGRLAVVGGPRHGTASRAGGSASLRASKSSSSWRTQDGRCRSTSTTPAISTQAVHDSPCCAATIDAHRIHGHPGDSYHEHAASRETNLRSADACRWLTTRDNASATSSKKLRAGKEGPR